MGMRRFAVACPRVRMHDTARRLSLPTRCLVLLRPETRFCRRPAFEPALQTRAVPQSSRLRIQARLVALEPVDRIEESDRLPEARVRAELIQHERRYVRIRRHPAERDVRPNAF